jgi:hypothetical protein
VTRGYNKPLNILPFDHRGSFETRLFGWEGELTADQTAQIAAAKRAYGLELRPSLMVRAIQELQESQIEPGVWKIEGLDRREDCAKVVSAARRNGRDEVGCIILGCGEDDKKRTFGTRSWASLAKKKTREAAVAEVARRFREFVPISDMGLAARAHAA